MVPRLTKFAVALTRSRQEAGDLVQATCERALSRAKQWQPGTRLDRWLFRIMQTIWFNEVKSRRRRLRRGAVEGAEDATVDGESKMQSRLILREIEQALFQLPEADGLVLVLVCVEGLSYRETAEVLDVPIGTVMSRLARARLTLEERIRGSRTAGPNVIKLSRNGKS